MYVSESDTKRDTRESSKKRDLVKEVRELVELGVERHLQKLLVDRGRNRIRALHRLVQQFAHQRLLRHNTDNAAVVCFKCYCIVI